MKLRIRGNSVRLRLERGEVAELAEKGQVSDELVFPPDGRHRLAYGLIVDPKATEVEVRGGPGHVSIAVPGALAREFTDTERVGFEGRGPLSGRAGGGEVEILVEKDFRCLHQRPGEDESDHYPHPAEA